MLAIEHISQYIPTTFEKADVQLAALNVSAPERKVFTKIYKLQRIPKAEKENFLSFMRKPLCHLLTDTAVTKQSIKYIIHTHTGRVIAPFGESILRELKYDLGLTQAKVFSVTLNNCASTIVALSIAEQLLIAESDPNARAIIIAADLSFTSILRLIPCISMLGDAAAAVILKRTSTGRGMLGHVTKIYGRYAEGGWMSKKLSIEFEEHYVAMLLDVIHAVLAKVNMNLTDIKLILPHNVNYISWEKVRSALAIPKEKIYLNNISRYGHCFGADIFINYCDAVADNYLQHGDIYMMVTVGLGATVSAAIFCY